MKKETIIGIAGVILLCIVYLVQMNNFKNASPLALIILTSAGLLLSLRFKLIGYTFLFFGSLALVVHPFLTQSSHWLIPGAALSGFAGLAGLINWWQNEK